jgi:hypothetical protein
MAWSPGLRVAGRLTLVALPLVVVASGSGLVVDGLYRDPSAVLPAIRGQDAVTLLVVPAVGWALARARGGSVQASVAWIGLLSYLGYTYLGAALAYRFNPLFLVYLAIGSITTAALGTALLDLNPRDDGPSPSPAARRVTAAFLGLVAIMLTVSELGQILPAIARGTIPDLIARSEGSGNFVYVFDLGLVVPLAFLAATRLWHGRPWGVVLSGFLLIKTATMGLALLSATWFSVRAGIRLEVGLTLGYATMTAGSLALLGLWTWPVRVPTLSR